jgi:hypothetical protein
MNTNKEIVEKRNGVKEELKKIKQILIEKENYLFFLKKD